MEPFTPFASKLAPLPRVNVDTDQITPARFLKSSRAAGGYGEILFYDWRYDEAGEPRPEFVLNRPDHQGARVLLAGDNFGCGSSRETAPWALVEHGFRAVVSSSFADIFGTNALKNGLLPITVGEEVLEELFRRVEEDPEVRVEVDLAEQRLTLPGGRRVSFPIDPFYRQCLLEGVDQLGYLLGRIPEVEAYEARHPAPVLTTAAPEG